MTFCCSFRHFPLALESFPSLFLFFFLLSFASLPSHHLVHFPAQAASAQARPQEHVVSQTEAAPLIWAEPWGPSAASDELQSGILWALDWWVEPSSLQRWWERLRMRDLGQDLVAGVFLVWPTEWVSLVYRPLQHSRSQLLPAAGDTSSPACWNCFPASDALDEESEDWPT